MINEKIRELIREALAEDIGTGDETSSLILSGREKGTARAVAKGDGIVIAGLDVFREVFLSLDETTQVLTVVRDGMTAAQGNVLAEIDGSLKSILTAERTALNFLQRMSGIATAARRFVEQTRNTKAVILDTRKTTPTLRELEKYAVRIGGASNHRFGLYDAIMIKDNHISAAGGVSAAIRKVTKGNIRKLPVEVEVKNLTEVREVLAAGGVDVIMLDNMSVPEMKEAVRLIGGMAKVEASGNVTLTNVREIAECGVDFISVGSITHSAPAADISLLFGAS